MEAEKRQSLQAAQQGAAGGSKTPGVGELGRCGKPACPGTGRTEGLTPPQPQRKSAFGHTL